jgi:hypothetical protein
LFFVDDAYEVILPVIANGSGLIITSSKPALNTNAMGLLTATTKDGKPVMKVLNWRRTCFACAEKEKRTQVEIECKHVSARPMHFRSRTDEQMLEAMMKCFGDTSYAREMLNQSAADNSRPFFHADAIADAFDTNSTQRISSLSTAVSYTVTSIDPGTKHGLSATAITTYCFVRHIKPDSDEAPRPPSLADDAGPEDQYMVVRLRFLIL